MPRKLDAKTADRKRRQGRAYARYLRAGDWGMAKMAANMRLPVPPWSSLPQRLKQYIMENFDGK